MKRISFLTFLLAAGLIFIFNTGLSAQEEEGQEESPQGMRLKSWSITLTPALAHPYTDIRYRDFFGATKPKNENQFGGSLTVTKMLSGAFGIQGQFVYTKLQGAIDKDVQFREDLNYAIQEYGFNNYPDGVYFTSTLYQGSANLYWNISNTVFSVNRLFRAMEKGEELKERKFSFYTYLGIGISRFDSELFSLANDEQIKDLTPKDDRVIQGKATEIVAPIGVGVKYKISKLFDIGLDYSFHNVFTDKLDTKVYDHPNRTKNDKYSLLGLSFTVKLGGKKTTDEHIEWRNPMESVYADMASVKDDLEALKKDSDGDGVSDYFDKEPDTPADAKIDGSGRQIDSDNDGVPDHLDEEPFSTKGAVVDETGKEKDSDGDGVPDSRDLEPNTEPGSLVNFEGITIGDALEIEKKFGQVGAPYPSVFFDFNKHNLRTEAKLNLWLLARTMLENPDLKVRLVGNTDVRGTESYNKDLGQKRAEAVKNFLVDNFGIDPARISTESLGESKPVSKIHEINRRVDIFIQQ